MRDENAVHSGNENSKRGPHGIIKRDAVAPQRGWERVADAGGPVPATIPAHGTTDIAHRLKNGETIYFPATTEGIVQSQLYFDKHSKDVFAIHFGETCAYIKREKIVAQVHMTRDAFFKAVQP